jgi:hypothetical protein
MACFISYTGTDTTSTATGDTNIDWTSDTSGRSSLYFFDDDYFDEQTDIITFGEYDNYKEEEEIPYDPLDLEWERFIWSCIKREENSTLTPKYIESNPRDKDDLNWIANPPRAPPKI